MAVVSKKMLAEETAGCQEISIREAEKKLDEAIDLFYNLLFLSTEDSVFCFGKLGRFKVYETKEKEGRNPKTGEKLVIPAKKKITFKPSKQFMTDLNTNFPAE
jgi:nucleoid DNA-binding protein